MNYSFEKCTFLVDYSFEKCTFWIFYWVSSPVSEVDFVIEFNGEIRVSLKNFGFVNGIKSIPLYAVFCIKNEE